MWSSLTLGGLAAFVDTRHGALYFGSVADEQGRPLVKVGWLDVEGRYLSGLSH
jgi:hypothetical protein